MILICKSSDEECDVSVVWCVKWLTGSQVAEMFQSGSKNPLPHTQSLNQEKEIKSSLQKFINSHWSLVKFG